MNLEQVKLALKKNKYDEELNLAAARMLAAENKHEESLQYYRRLIRINPRSVRNHLEYAGLLSQLGRAEKSAGAVDEALQIDPSIPDACYMKGINAANRGDFREADTFIRRALKARPSESKWRIEHQRILKDITPAWHIPMLHDRPRNELYQSAIEAQVQDGMHVLEIGTGSGLLAMMAARAGAAHVTTCELEPVIAEKARQIISANGLSGKITVINKDSQELQVGQDIPQPADLLLSEVIGAYFLGERVLSSIDDAMKRLVKPGAPSIPVSEAAMCALFETDSLQQCFSVSEAGGFDISAFSELAPYHIELPRDTEPVLLSEPVEAYSFDLRNIGGMPGGREIEFKINRPGEAMGVLQWVRINLDDKHVYENRPPEGLKLHWPISATRFERPLTVEPTETVTAYAITDGATISFFR